MKRPVRNFPKLFCKVQSYNTAERLKNNPDSQCALGKFTSYPSGTDCIDGLYKGGNLTRVV